MFTKLKNKIEAWFRRIVAEEVAKLDVSLQREKAEIHTRLQVFGSQLEAFQAEALGLLRMLEQSTPENVRAANKALVEMRDKATLMMDAVKKLNPSLGR